MRATQYWLPSSVANCQTLVVLNVPPPKLLPPTVPVAVIVLPVLARNGSLPEASI